MSVLKNEPRGKYDGEKINDHNFVHKCNEARNIARVTTEAFTSWCDEVTTGFTARNMMSLPIKMCENMPGVMIDTRTFIEIVKLNQQQTAAMTIQIHHIHQQIKTLTNAVTDLTALVTNKVSNAKVPEVSQYEESLYEEIVPNFITIIKPKLEALDIANVAFEWHTNATIDSWKALNKEEKNNNKYFSKERKRQLSYLDYL